MVHKVNLARAGLEEMDENFAKALEKMKKVKILVFNSDWLNVHDKNSNVAKTSPYSCNLTNISRR